MIGVPAEQDSGTPAMTGLGYPIWPGLGYPPPRTGYAAGSRSMPLAISDSTYVVLFLCILNTPTNIAL